MIEQRPQIEGNWLYKDENNTRLFSQYVCRPDNSLPWKECTNEEKEAWEAEHPQPEPEPEGGEG